MFSSAVCRARRATTHTLGLGTVAEGIETEGQAQLMAELGCDKGQGYLYSKPLETAALVAWVQARIAPPAG
nr:EAL domain-containing protein [Rhodoferax sp.]